MIKVILADHERIFRIGIASVLSCEDDIRIVGQPSTPGQLVGGVEKFRPHVAVLSSAFLGCLDAIEQSCRRQHTALLLLQDYSTGSLPLVPEDFHGVIRRSADSKTLVECVRHLARGGRVIRLTPTVSHDEASDAIGKRVRERLTGRELVIMSYVVRGFKNREVALHLGTTEQAIKNSLRLIFDKTGVYGRLELALFVAHHRTLQATSFSTLPAADVISMADPQRHWAGNRRANVH
jgi:DNA-binding NarL/FixJ family response regulator